MTQLPPKYHIFSPAIRHSSRPNDEGVALILVLVFVLLLSVLVVDYAYEAQVDAAHTASQNDQFAAYIAAKSAVSSGLALLAGDLMQQQMMSGANNQIQQVKSQLTQSQQSQLSKLTGGVGGLGEQYDGCTDLWYNPPAIPPMNGAEAKVWVTDECGKINLNALVDANGNVNEFLQQTLRILFKNLQVEEDPTDAIVDWIDVNEDSSSNGAESDYYGGLESPYAAKNGHMDSIEELLLIRGITPELYFDLNRQPGDEDLMKNPNDPLLSLPDLLTVHGDPRGLINVNTAPRLVLEALAEAAGAANVGDMSQLVTELRTNPVTSPQEIAQRLGMAAATDRLDVKSSFYRIQGDGQINNTMVRIETYVFRNAQQSQIEQQSSSKQNGQGTGTGDSKQTPSSSKTSTNGKKNTSLSGDSSQNGTMESFKILDWRVIR